MAELASTAGSEWAAPAAPRPAEIARDDAMWHLYERRYADMVRFAAFLTGDVDAARTSPRRRSCACSTPGIGSSIPSALTPT
jgi:hypothetical protein